MACNAIGAEGASKLAAILKETQIQQLECSAPQSEFAFVSMPVDMPPSLGSLANNQLCGVSPWGGTYTTEGITQLCEALPLSASHS